MTGAMHDILLLCVICAIGMCVKHISNYMDGREVAGGTNENLQLATTNVEVRNNISLNAELPNPPAHARREVIKCGNYYNVT